ncbi:ABC transporter substrate-binding protein [Deltaproteobacteria bacterium TL4]
MTMDINISILIVDDSNTMLAILNKNLKQIGYSNIITATEGQDAINKLKENAVDLIISDWNMPQMDGLELLQWVRKDEKYKAIPFLMATAQADKTQQEIVKKEQGHGLIAKPFDENELKNAIEEVFGIAKAPAEKRESRTVKGKIQMKMAHIQITDHLILGVLKHWLDSGEVTTKYFDLETVCLPGWNPVVKALEDGEVDGALMLAPIAMDMFGFNVPIKLVLLAHKNGSIFIRSNKYSLDVFGGSLHDFYKYKVVNIPHKMSIHNMLAHRFLKELGLLPGVPGKKSINVRFEVVPPIQMPGIMKRDDKVAGFIVAEPIGSNAVAQGIGDIEFLSSTAWDNHPCCVCTMRDEFIAKNTEALYEFTSLLVKAGKFIEENKEKAAEIAVNFLDPQKKLGLTTEVLSRVLKMVNGITMKDLYPKLEDLDTIQRYMHDEMDIGVIIDVEEFADLRFADEACR